MKKLLVLFVCLLMVFTTVGCGGGGTKVVEEGDPVTLNFWGHQNVPWNASWEKIGKDFTAKYPHITINFEFFPWEDYELKLNTSLQMKEQGADIYEMWGGMGVDICPTGALAALPDVLAQQIRDEFYAPTYAALDYEGKIYGFPLEFNIEAGAMLFNSKLAKEFDIAAPTTWDEMIASAQKVVQYKGKNMSVKGFDFVNEDGVPYLLMSMILSKGGSFLAADGSFNFDTEIGRECYQEMYDLIKVKKVTDIMGIVDEDLEGYLQLFVDKVLFVPRGPWVIAEGEMELEVKYGEDFEYVAMPWFGNNVKFPSESGWALAINSASPYQDAAYKFMEFVSQNAVIEAHNVACAQIPAKIAVANDPGLLELMPFAAPIIPILDNAVYIGNFNTQILKDEAGPNFQAFIAGKYKTAEAALAALDKALNRAAGR